MKTPLGMEEIIRHAILALQIVIGTTDDAREKDVKILPGFRPCLRRTRTKRLHGRFPLLLRHLLIVEAVLLATEVPTEHHVAALLAIDGKERVAAIGAILEHGTPVALHAIDEFIRKLGIARVGAIRGIAAMVGRVRIEHIFAVSGVDAEVTIPAVPHLIHIGAILIEHRGESHAGDTIAERDILLEERTGEVEGASIRGGIPPIGVPVFRGVDGERLVLRIDRKNLFPHQIILAPVQIALVAVGIAPLRTALPTERGWRNVEGDSPDDRRKFLQHRKIITGDLEGLLAPRIFAGVLHGRSVYLLEVAPSQETFSGRSGPYVV